MKLKRKLFVLLLLCFLNISNFVQASNITALTNAGDEISINAIPDTTTGSVEISGNLPQKQKTDFFLLILKDSSVSLSSINNDNFLLNVDFFIQETTDDEGKFSVTCLPMTTWNENEHKVFIACSQKDSQVFSVPSEETESAIIATIEGATNEDIKKLLTGESLIGGVTVNTYLGLDLSLYQTLEDKTSVHNSVAGKTFVDTKAISQTLRAAIDERATIEIEEKSNAEFLNKIKGATEAEAIEIIENNDARLSLDLTGTYGYSYLKSLYDNGEKSPLQTVISKLKTISSLSSAGSVFKDSVVLESVKAADWQTLDDVLEAYKTELAITNLDEFNNLSNSKKADLLRELVLLDFSDLSKVKSEFTSLIEKYSAPSRTDNGGGGGGGSLTFPNKEPKEEKEELSFTDIAEGHWANSSIMFLADKGILSGYPDGSFKPDKSVNREEFVKMLIVALGLYDKNSECQFEDVDKESWYYPYVASACKNEIVNGMGNIFGSGENITREQAATMIYRSAVMFNKTFEEGMKFIDGDSISEYAKEAVSAIAGTVINGDENGNFNPFASTTRAQAAKMIYQLLKMN